MSNRSLTLIIPNYNHGHLLPRCLDSVTAQSFQPAEILICDDASTDDSLDVIKYYTQSHSHIRLIRNEENRGVLATIRRLASEATGELVVGCAADDELSSGYLESVMKVAREEGGTKMFLSRMVFRNECPRQNRTIDREICLNRNCHLTPIEFREVPPFLEHCLRWGISISAIYDRKVFMEALSLSTPLGVSSDIFERLYIGCKYGMSLVDVPGNIFYNTPGGYSRGDTLYHALRSAAQLAALSNMLKSEDFSGLFPRHFRAKVDHACKRMALGTIEKQVIDPYHDATSSYFTALHSVKSPCPFLDRLLAKVTGFSRSLQRQWLNYCVRRLWRNSLIRGELLQPSESRPTGSPETEP